jgi:DNA-binding IclR family transcriptional regulator
MGRPRFVDFAGGCLYTATVPRKKRTTFEYSTATAGWSLPMARVSSAGVDGAGHRSLYRVQVLDRAILLVDALAVSGVALGPAEIALQVGLHKSTVHRLLAVLEEHRLVSRNPGDGKYILGGHFLELANRSAEYRRLRTGAGPVLQRLVNETGETAHVAVLDGIDMVSLANVEAPWSERLPSAVGRRSPLYCTAIGKCATAFLPGRDIKRLVAHQTFTRLTRHTIVTATAFSQELGRVRELGFAVDDEESREGLRCVSAPVRDANARVIAAISVTGPAFRVTQQRVPSIARSAMEAARELSAAIARQASPTRRSA